MPEYSHRLWSGTLTFGLVSLQVALVPAVHSRRKSFHLLHAKDHARLERRMLCPEHNHFVHREHMVLGYETRPDHYVVMQPSEIEALEPDRSSNIEIVEFVNGQEIDPVYYDRPYYLVPREAGKPYQLLVETLASENKVGIAQFVMAGRQYLVAVRSIDGVLCLLTLHYRNDLLKSPGLMPKVKSDGRMLQKVQTAMGKMHSHFDMARYKDPYQERLDQFFRDKQRRKGVVEAPHAAGQEASVAEGNDEEPTDLVAALEQSLAQVRSKE